MIQKLTQTGGCEIPPFYSIKRELLLALLCFLSAILLWSFQDQREQRALAGRIAPGILRFHVIGNSNSRADQERKLQVKSFLLEQIEKGMGAPADWEKSDVKQFLLENREKLEQETEDFLCSLGGRADPVSLDIVWQEFPEKFYGNLSLPAGSYEAAQIRIGNGRGRNWWCVLYPKVCVTKDAVTQVPEASLERFQKLLSEEDFQALKAQRPEIHIKLRSLEWAAEQAGRLRGRLRRSGRALTEPARPVR
ncbi:MAG: stage II sporulation protein R [Lachnospiraceae bacterium]|nr:stage II sporulation protein R [Lachnospiraceae bacterium]